MAQQDRNRSRYVRPTAEQSLDNPNECTPKFLADCWARSRRRDPIGTKYEAKYLEKSLDSESLSGETTAAALELLAEITGDDAFRTALLALRGYGLDQGGLKEMLKRRLRGTFGARPAVRMVIPRMSAWRARVQSDTQAARLTAAQMGVPGQSFEAVVEELRKAYPKWMASVDTKRPAEIRSLGDTGRKLKIRWAAGPWLGVGNVSLTEIRSVQFAADGTACAPDDKWWRNAIRDGHFHLCGIVEAGR